MNVSVSMLRHHARLSVDSLVGDLRADIAADGGDLEPVALPLLAAEGPAGLDHGCARTAVRGDHLPGAGQGSSGHHVSRERVR